jgi:hypothetical protein
MKPQQSMALLKLNEFRTLEAGWCYGEGVALKDSPLIDPGVQIATALIQAGFVDTDAFPGIHGEVRVTAYKGDHYLEFTCEGPDRITFAYELEQNEIEFSEGISLKEAINKIKDYRKQIWPLSDFFLDSTMTQNLAVFKASPSSLPPKEDSPSFSTHAPWRLVEANVPTSDVSIKSRPVSRQFTVSSHTSSSIPPHCSIEETLSDTGDPCHRDIMGLTVKQAKNTFKSLCCLEGLFICDQAARDSWL